MSASDARPRIPEGYRVERELAAGSQGRVYRAAHAGRSVVLRVAPPGAGAESVQELAVLAALRHPGLAALVDHGVLGDASVWLARSWVEGEELGRWWSAHRGDAGAAEALGRVAVALCAALEHLHARGFVHGDLKPANVLVGPDARPVLTDFGLARALGAAGSTAGTPFFAAPEVLQGGPAGPAVDLFALGALLVRLWIPRELRAADLYARFPADGFLEALGVRVEELPEWARDLVPALLDRDPEERPRSAAAVGRALAGRLGLAWTSAERPAIEFGPLEGRAAWRDAEIERLHTLAQGAGGCVAWRAPAGEDVERLARAMRLAAAVRGLATRALDAARVAGAEPGSRALDGLADEIAATAQGTVLVLVPGDDPAARARAAHVGRAVARARGVLVCVSRAEAAGDGWAEVAVPPVTAADVERFVAREIDAGSAERARAFAALLHAGEPSAAAVERRLARAVGAGHVLAGEARPRLRPGPLPTASELAAQDGAARALDAAEARLLAALAVLGGRAPSGAVLALAGAEAAAGLDGLAPLARRAAGELVLDVDARALPIPAATWRELHAARARALEAAGAPRASWLPHAAAAADETGLADGLRAVLLECEALRERGEASLALDVAERAEAHLRAQGRGGDPRLACERALGWIRAGAPERAEQVLAGELGGAAPAVRALRARVEAALAAERHQHEQALEHARLARALDPAHAAAAVDLEARVLFELRRDDDLERLAEQSATDPAVTPRVRANAQNLLAASLQRRGLLERSRALSETLLAQARAEGDPGREAALCQNLATLERRVGRLAVARGLLERAEEVHAQGGSLAGLAHVRAQLGGLLREMGELVDAGAPLGSAVDLAERLGDATGAAVARGTHGLLLAERGHAQAALLELQRATADLERAGRRSHAALLDARAEETLARLGRPPGAAERGRRRGDAAALDADPRALLALARAAWMRIDAPLARQRAERAEALARSLGQAALADEAAALVAALRNERPAATAAGGDDERALAALTDAPDAADVRALAEELEARGRDDRAARLWIALCARAQDPAEAKAAAARAEALLAACTRGLSEPEAQALRRHLLSRPDPRPSDLHAFDTRGGEDTEFEMDVVRLLEINQRLVEEQDLEKLLGAIVESALSVTGAQRGFLVLEEDGALVFDTARDSRRGDIDAPELEISRSVVQQALEAGAPLRLSNATEDPELSGAPSVSALDLRSILCVPFGIDDGVRGVIYVDHRVRAGAFGERAERLLALLAGQAALAIRQVRRIEEIRRLNRELSHEVAHKESDLRTAQEALRDAGMAGVPTGLVGRSPAMRRVHELVTRFAESDMAVLVTGESGTGKELAARALHARSPRAAGPFVVENCAALPPSLIEAELFGARRGAYTGADLDRPGLFERADGGTLFLDEIGELPLELQAKLLRVLETGEVRRLGESRVRQVVFRLVAATNRDLEAEVRAARFRADLYYRLDGLRVAMPSLSERVEDVPLLVEHFLRVEEAKSGQRRVVTPQVLAALSRRAWPGNVRELRNEVARLCVLCPADLDDPSLVRAAAPGAGPRAEDAGVVPLVPLAELERLAIERAIEAAGGDKGQAAKLLGISRAKVYQRLKEWRGEDGDAPPDGAGERAGPTASSS